MYKSSYASLFLLVTSLSLCGSICSALSQPRLGCRSDGGPATLNLSTGVATWTLSGPGEVGPFAVVVTTLAEGWVPNQGGAEWVGPTADGDPTAAPGRYVYKLRVETGNCAVPGTVTLSGFIAGDNKAKVLVDGAIVSATVDYPYGFAPPNPVSFANIAFPATGHHKIEIVVKNQAQWTGALMKAVLTRTIP